MDRVNHSWPRLLPAHGGLVILGSAVSRRVAACRSGYAGPCVQLGRVEVISQPAATLPSFVTGQAKGAGRDAARVVPVCLVAGCSPRKPGRRAADGAPPLTALPLTPPARPAPAQL